MRKTFSWLHISRGIYKLGNRAPGNTEVNAFPKTCRKDTETSFQGPRLKKRLHKSQTHIKLQLEGSVRVSQNVHIGRACSPGLWFYKSRSSGWGADRTVGPALRFRGPQSSASPLPWTLTSSLISSTNKKKFPLVPLPLGNDSLLHTMRIPLF